jgi:hypothetical protein
LAGTNTLPALTADAKSVVANALADIKQSVQKTANAILDLAEILYKYSLKKEWYFIREELVNSNTFSDSVLKKLLPIGQNKILTDKKHREQLPFGYNHLYPLTQIQNDTLEKLIDKGDVHIGLTVEEANRLKVEYAESAPSSNKTKSATQDTITYTVKFKISKKRVVQSQVNDALNIFRKKLEKIDSEVTFYEK